MSPCEMDESCTRSKWVKEDLNSFICCWLMPLASRVRIWVSISLMVRAIVVRSNSHPTRMCCGCGTEHVQTEKTHIYQVHVCTYRNLHISQSHCLCRAAGVYVCVEYLKVLHIHLRLLFMSVTFNTVLYLHSVVGVLVVKHQGLLDELVVSLQLVNVGFISNNDVLKLFQLCHLVLQGASYFQGAASNFLFEQDMPTRSTQFLDYLRS